MSEYGYLVCHDHRTYMGLGKACKQSHDTIWYYHAGPSETPRNWQRPDLAPALWRMLADHTGCNIRVLREFSEEHERWCADSDARGLYVAIGGDNIFDIPFETYLAGWPG